MLATFLAEDGAFGDITTQPLGLEEKARGRVVAKEGGRASGMRGATQVFSLLDRSVQAGGLGEGDAFQCGDTVLEVIALAPALLSGERVAMNLLGRACGIATRTAQWVEEMNDPSVELLDTRKTAPGLRWLDKDAVLAGGGVNHRNDLGEMVLLKENHHRLVGGITAAVWAIREVHPGVDIEVEVETVEELIEALDLEIERVMLDDWDEETMAEGIRLAQEKGVYVELSGGVQRASLRRWAALGPDGISSGALTSSAPPIDLSFQIEPFSSTS